MVPFDDDEIKKTYYHLFNDFSSVLGQYSSKEDSVVEELTMLHNPNFLTFLKSSPGITAIIDFQNEGYVFMSDNVEEMWGYKAEEFLRLGLVKTITIFPVSQNEIIINKIFPVMFDYFHRHAEAGDVCDLRVSYNTKVVRADGSVGWYLHQMKVLHVDEHNKIQFGFKLISDISDFKKDEAIDMVIAKKDHNGIFKKIFSQTFITDKKTFAISTREIQILELIGEGKSSKEIADMLFISEHTVFNHRKNMIKKLGVKSTGEILKKAIAHGII
jgi:DNA-binding CsgD family transcriptional regulator